MHARPKVRSSGYGPLLGDGAPVADMLVDEFSMTGTNLLLPKAADAVASLTMTAIATPS